MSEDIYFREFYENKRLSAKRWEELLLDGWDHVGNHYYRRRYDIFNFYNCENDEFTETVLQLLPLRYRLDTNFAFSKSQRIIQSRNSDLRTTIGPVVMTDEKLILFNNWYVERFGRLGFIDTWVSTNGKPFPITEICFYKHDKLIACSYFEQTKHCNYSLIAPYDPNESKRSLGTFSLLCEINFGMSKKKWFHFPGHAHYENTWYDYKKKFNNAEGLDWETMSWRTVKRL